MWSLCPCSIFILAFDSPQSFKSQNAILESLDETCQSLKQLETEMEVSAGWHLTASPPVGSDGDTGPGLTLSLPSGRPALKKVPFTSIPRKKREGCADYVWIITI